MYLRETGLSPTPKSKFMDDARQLFASTMYSFSGLQLVLLLWQRGEQADQGLSDSDAEDEPQSGDGSEEGNSSTEPAVRYSTQEAYNRYVIHPSLAHECNRKALTHWIAGSTVE